MYFHQGDARATVFIGDSKARTFDFTAGDTAAFPDNAGEYTFHHTGDLLYKANCVPRSLHRKHIGDREIDLDRDLQE